LAKPADPSGNDLPNRLGQWWPPGPADVVNVDRWMGPTYSLLPVGPTTLGQGWPPGPANSVFIGRVADRLSQCCPRGRPDMVSTGRPGRPTWPRWPVRPGRLSNCWSSGFADCVIKCFPRGRPTSPISVVRGNRLRHCWSFGVPYINSVQFSLRKTNYPCFCFFVLMMGGHVGTRSISRVVDGMMHN
jgi:hypothetical protein